MKGLLRNPAYQWGLTAVTCLLAGLLAYVVVGLPLAPAVFWPASGVALAVGMLWGMPVATGVAVGIGLAVFLQGEGFFAVMTLGFASIAQVAVGRILLHLAGGTARLARVPDLLRLMLYGGVLAGLVAMPMTFLALEGVDGFWELDLPLQISTLVFAHLDSVLIFGTLVLCLVNPTCHQGVAKHLEGWLILMAVGLFSMVLAHPEIFGLPGGPMRPYPLLPFLLWLALRTDARFVALAMAWIYGVMSVHVSWGYGFTTHIDDQWLRPLHGFITVVGLSFLALSLLMTENRRLAKANLAEALAQRDALIREVHHRIKNNLQIVVGLLRRDVAQHPEVKPLLESAINQVQSIAVVHGLHGRVTQQGVMLCELLPAIGKFITELSGAPVILKGIPEGCGRMRIQESETVALALILNELISNAVKHMGPSDEWAGPQVSLIMEEGLGRVSIRNPGQLPKGFDFGLGLGLGTGLGLVSALMPSPGVKIDFFQEEGVVVAEMLLGPPLLAILPKGEWVLGRKNT